MMDKKDLKFQQYLNTLLLKAMDGKIDYPEKDTDPYTKDEERMYNLGFYNACSNIHDVYFHDLKEDDEGQV